MTTPVLLTLDEARDLLGGSAIALVEAVPCSPTRLARLLAGKGATGGLSSAARQAVRAHRAVLRQVLACDHTWILKEQLEGALSYADCYWEPTAGTLASASTFQGESRSRPVGGWRNG